MENYQTAGNHYNQDVKMRHDNDYYNYNQKQGQNEEFQFYTQPNYQQFNQQQSEFVSQEQQFIQEQNQQFEQEIDEEDMQNDSEDEGIQDYKMGGYHPPHIGEIINKRYVLIQKLGWGHFSTVWLSKDFKYDTYVAVKIQKSSPHYMEAAFDEVEILQRVAKNVDNPEWKKSCEEYYKDEKDKNSSSKDDCKIVQLLNSFVYKGPYGTHFCMVFEILGVNLLEIIKRYNYQGIPMHLARIIAKQILIGLDYLHRICGVIHTDLKPENVLLQLTQEQIRDIVENGQLANNVSNEERIEKFRKKYDIQVKKQENQEGLTKQQKKNQKKKQQKKKAKLRKNEEQSELETNEETSQIPTEQTATQKPTKISFNNLNMRGEPIDESVKIKIADLGNACFTHHHFSTEIQTRQYRSPEVILGINYNTTADNWSFACMIFEMLTGDFLFEPRKNEHFSKDEDHLAQVQELIQKFPKSFSLSGKKSYKFFDKSGNLRRIPQLQHWPLVKVLTEKYKLKQNEANAFSKFLLPMLECIPYKRQSAKDALKSSWLKMPPNLEFKLSDYEIQLKLSKKQLTGGKEEVFSFKDDNSQINDADVSDSQSAFSDVSDIFKDITKKTEIKQNMIDRSFTNLGYIGYGDGIQLDELDCNTNWQFE